MTIEAEDPKTVSASFAIQKDAATGLHYRKHPDGRMSVEGFLTTDEPDNHGHVLTFAGSGKALDYWQRHVVGEHGGPTVAKAMSVEPRPEAKPRGYYAEVMISASEPGVQKKVEEGILVGFSVEGPVTKKPHRVQKDGRTLLVIEDWRCESVALVSNVGNNGTRFRVRKDSTGWKEEPDFESTIERAALGTVKKDSAWSLAWALFRAGEMLQGTQEMIDCEVMEGEKRDENQLAILRQIASLWAKFASGESLELVADLSAAAGSSDPLPAEVMKSLVSLEGRLASLQPSIFTTADASRFAEAIGSVLRKSLATAQPATKPEPAVTSKELQALSAKLDGMAQEFGRIVKSAFTGTIVTSPVPSLNASTVAAIQKDGSGRDGTNRERAELRASLASLAAGFQDAQDRAELLAFRESL